MDKGFKKIQKDMNKPFEEIKKLLEKNKTDINAETLEKIPKVKGVYVFYNNETGEAKYIGSATGNPKRRGLYQRIKKEHLYPKYKYKKKNEEHSVFRNAIATEHKLQIGKDVVNHIKENFNLSYIEMDEEEDFLIRLIERLLIWGFRRDKLYNKK